MWSLLNDIKTFFIGSRESLAINLGEIFKPVTNLVTDYNAFIVEFFNAIFSGSPKGMVDAAADLMTKLFAGTVKTEKLWTG